MKTFSKFFSVLIAAALIMASVHGVLAQAADLSVYTLCLGEDPNVEPDINLWDENTVLDFSDGNAQDVYMVFRYAEEFLQEAYEAEIVTKNASNETSIMGLLNEEPTVSGTAVSVSGASIKLLSGSTLLASNGITSNTVYLKVVYDNETIYRSIKVPYTPPTPPRPYQPPQEEYPPQTPSEGQTDEGGITDDSNEGGSDEGDPNKDGSPEGDPTKDPNDDKSTGGGSDSSGGGGGGSNSTTKTTTNPDGSKTTVIITKTAKGTTTTSTTTNTDGSKVVEKNVENKDGSSEYTYTEISKAGTEKTTALWYDKNGAVTSVTQTMKNAKGVGATFEYSASGTKLTLKNINTDGKTSITIPSTVKANGQTFKVTKVGANALKGNKEVKSVNVGKNITSIGKNAFNGDSKLKTITVKGKVTSVGKNAFADINKKATIKIDATKKVYKTVKKAIQKSSVAKTVKFKRVK